MHKIYYWIDLRICHSHWIWHARLYQGGPKLLNNGTLHWYGQPTWGETKDFNKMPAKPRHCCVRLLLGTCRLHNGICGWASKKWSLQVDLTNKIYVAVSDLQSLEKLPLGGGLGDENYVNQFLPYGRRCASHTWGLLPRAPIARSMKFHWGMHLGIMIIIAVMSIITTSPRCYCSPPIGPRFTGYLKLYEASSLAAGNCGLLLNLLICWSLCNLSNFRSLVKPQY